MNIDIELLQRHQQRYDAQTESFCLELMGFGVKKELLHKFVRMANEFSEGTRFSHESAHLMVIETILNTGIESAIDYVNNLYPDDKEATAVDISSQLSLTASKNKTGHA